nr:DUF2812 domain-containing protein [uncultured Aminipila sp.]
MTEEADKQINWSNKLYMLHENELWLSEQAQKGLLLKSFAKDYACFTEGEPQNIAYKIVILDVNKANNQIKIIEHQGFTFVESYFEYYIFYIDGKYKHIQPRLNEEMNKVASWWFNKQMFKRFGGTLIALIPFLINLAIDRHELLQNIVEAPGVLLVALLVIFTVLIIDSLKEYRALGRNKKHYLVNEFYITRKSGKKSISKYIMIIAFIFLGVSLIKYFYFDPHQYSIEEVQKTMPIVLLQDIEKDKKVSKELRILQKIASDDNYAEISHTFLASKQYMANQESTYEDKYNNVIIRYYEVSVKILAEPLARELLISNVFGLTKGELKEIEYDGLDKVYYNDGYMDFISVCKGNKVMFISYAGDKPVSDILNEATEVL